MDTLPAGSKIKAKLKVYTDNPVEFSLFDKNYTIPSSEIWGKESGFSNELEIKSVPNFEDKVVSPVSHATCTGVYVSRGWTNSNYNYGHDGTDYAKWDGCKVVSVGYGQVLRTRWGNGGQGYYVLIKHKEDLYSMYMHGTGDFYVKEGAFVEPGTEIMFMGTTGNSTGVHLHFSLWDHYPWSQSPPRSLNPLQIPINF
jgi:murein DD-endopeptidase MepM/ murein hydrolase activator NlpD